jgi:microsomal dipeptidase-like Zn-dependent dipeptidase
MINIDFSKLTDEQLDKITSDFKNLNKQIRNNMTVKDLKEFLNKLDDNYNDHELNVVISRPNAIGGTPKVGVRHIGIGFDFDNGTLMIETQTTLIEKPKKK